MQPVVPESFRDRRYAREHYAVIARWAAKHHPFYMKRVRGDAPEFGVITRADVQDDNDTLLNGHEPSGRTSGSTAEPVLVSWSKERSDMDRRDTAAFVRWLGGPLPNMRIVALSAHAPNERTMEVTEPTADHVEFMRRRHRADGACSLVTYPSNLDLICRYVLEHGIDMSFMRRVVCLSEVYEPWHDELVRQAFPNALATCTYSSVELGMIAGRCPHRPENYHIMAHKLGVEFLDAEGRPCREGEPGQVVITDYWNRRSTMIRYALGDLAAPATCGCGRIVGPAMTQVIGKVRGVLKHGDGRPVLFTGLSPMFRDSPEIRQFQVVQPALGQFVVKYVPRAGAAMEGFFERVLGRFREDFGVGVEVAFEPCESIPRSAGGKFHGAICHA
jgi:phenylacetate-CoA ligase